MTDEERKACVPEAAPVAARAPYNFVPFSEDVLFRYTGEEELPPHCGLDPALKSGEILFSLTADSPVFFSGFLQENDGSFPFYRVEGRCAVPASSVRGAVRSSMKILTCGKLREGEDYPKGRLLYRQPHVPKEGKIRRPLAESYAEVLGMDYSRQEKYRLSTPKNVCAGYLHCRGKSYFIRPAEHKPFWVKTMHPVLRDFLAQQPDRLREESLPVWYRTDFRPDGSEVLTEIRGEPSPDMREGMLLFRSGYRKQNNYLFPRELPGGQEICLSREDVEACENISRFRILPREGERRPVFYVLQETEEGVRVFCSRSWYPHIAFRNSLKNGVPPAHWERTPGVDYASAVFGKKDRRSRVLFTDCIMDGDAVGLPLPEVRRRLMPPQPVYYPNYTEDGRNYDDPDFRRLRGYKQYWLKDPDWQALSEPVEERAARKTLQEKGNDATVGFVPLPEGSRFFGSIRFRNLHPDELGALLWALKLEAGCFHSMGRGRPLGFGRMKVEIHRLACYDVQTLYRSLSPAAVDETEQIADYIEAYQTYAAAQLPDGVRPENRPEIRDYFYIRKTVCKGRQVEYMSKEEHRDVRIPLPTIRDIREGRVEFC